MIACEDRLQEALSGDDHSVAVPELARRLCDEGMEQFDMYLLFSKFQQSCDSDDPRYDSIVDTMDLIGGGRWAKGRAFYDHELTDDEIEQGRRTSVW